ncbi:MAG: hypothetical protein ACI857_003181 [Arenicella sp.]
MLVSLSFPEGLFELNSSLKSSINSSFTALRYKKSPFPIKETGSQFQYILTSELLHHKRQRQLPLLPLTMLDADAQF